MKKSTLIGASAIWWLAAVLLPCVIPRICAAATGSGEDTPATDPRLDMVTALKATGPHPSLGDRAKVFGRLVGTWNVEYADFKADGEVTHRSGDFIVGWIMDGHAIQDFWIVYPPGACKDREVYTDLRYCDPKSGTWCAVFIGAEHASIARFTGGAVGDDRIVLESRDFDGADARWSINDIRADSFVWREEESADRGKTRRLLAEDHMKRRGVAPRTL